MILMNREHIIDLNSEAVRLESFDISGYEIKAQLGSSRGLCGSVLHGISLGERDVKIEGYIASSHEEKRHALAKICSQNEPFYLVDGEYRLELVAKRGPELSCQKRFLNKLLKFTIYARSVNPLWQASQEQVVQFYSIGGVSDESKNMKITNSGDVPVGFLLEVSMRTSADKLIITKNSERIEISHSFEIGDKVFIDTRRGKKGVEVLLSQNNKLISIINELSLGSTLFELDVGENTLGFSVLTGLTNMKFLFSPCYLR